MFYYCSTFYDTYVFLETSYNFTYVLFFIFIMILRPTTPTMDMREIPVTLPMSVPVDSKVRTDLLIAFLICLWS